MWLAFTATLPTPAYAIPSPELIVGSFVSLSQLFALAAAVLGGGGAYAAMRSRNGAAGVGRSRTLIAAVVGLAVLLCASVGLNLWQYMSDARARQAALEETLTRPAPRELSYSQQLRHPLGITTEDAERMLRAAARGEATNVLALDVRERAERALGGLPGALPLRAADLAASGIDLTGKTAIVADHDGDRSHALCETLKPQGIDCRFIVGGLQKWMIEGRALTGTAQADALRAPSVDPLRASPPWTNDTTLLTPAQARRLVAEEKAILVDVRDPAEARLPGAIPLALHRMPADTLAKEIAALPKRPIILPCADRRSCHLAAVLGFELTQAGHDVRGRFTQPGLLGAPAARPPYVEAFIADRDKSVWDKAASWLAAALGGPAQAIGLVAVILLLAAASRLLVLPFSLKSERDQIRARAVAGEFEALTAKLAHDPVRRGRAIRAFYRRHGLTPARNLIALAFLPVMALALVAVQELAVEAQAPFLWVGNLAGRDTLTILPVAFAVLITLYVDLAFARTMLRGAAHTWLRRAAIWLVLFPLMVATGTLFSAAGDLYLIMSAALLVLQRLWVDGRFAAWTAAWRRRRPPAGTIPLDDAGRLAGHGNKALRLGQLKAAGLPVPDGLLVTAERAAALATMRAEEREAALEAIWQHLGGVPLAVRSCAAFEDGAEHSFAGVFESVLNVTREGLGAAIEQVRASYKAAGAYKANGGSGGVLLQRMVTADYAGVLFTRAPDASGLMMVELVVGTAQDLVSGSVKPQSFRFGRASKKKFGGSNTPIDLAPLLALGEAAERLFGTAQDVEWTHADGKFLLVQSRDITRGVAGDAAAAAMQADIARVLEPVRDEPADAVVYARTELSEMLPRPTPVSLSLMQALYAPGGSVEMAARRLKLSYPAAEGQDYLVTILCRLYVDKRAETARALTLGWAARRRLIGEADAIERDIRETFVPELLAQVRLGAVADFDKLTGAELVDEIRRLADHFVNDTHVAVDTVNIAAFVYLDHARRLIERKGADASALLGHIPETIEGKALAEISARPDKTSRWLAMQTFGHRAALDYELAEPRFGEDVETLDRMVAARAPAKPADGADVPKLGRRAQRALDLARRFQTLKEDAKHHSLRELALIRKALLALDRRLALGGLVFQLTLEEITALDVTDVASMQRIAASRAATAALLRKQRALPAQLTPHDLEAVSAGDVGEMHLPDAVIRGTRVAGSAVAEGRAFVVSEEAAEHGDPMEGFRDGDIVVTAMINPAWLPYFSRAGGFVSEVGGWLSHPAILAREYDVPMVVGVEGLQRIAPGTRLRLLLDGRIEVLDADATAADAAAA